MSIITTDPSYRALAAGAAARLGGGPDVTRAILGQWACELAGSDGCATSTVGTAASAVISVKSLSGW